MAIQALAITDELLRPSDPTLGAIIGSDGAPSSVYVTSLAILALQRYDLDFQLGLTLNSAALFLTNCQQIAGGWGTDWETALAISAVARVILDVQQFDQAIELLESNQLANGSWSNDAYATALAIQALAS